MPHKPRLVFLQRGTRFAPTVEIHSTKPETRLAQRQEYLLKAFENYTNGIDTERVEKFFQQQDLRIAPYRLLDEDDSKKAQQLGILDGLMGMYKPSHDVALFPRHTLLEVVNSPEFTESMLVHELAHGTNEYHDLVYMRGDTREHPSIRHGRSGHRVYDTRGNYRGRFLEEAYAERQRGKYVERVLERPRGFARGTSHTNYFLEGAAMVSAEYTICRIDGKPSVITEAFAASIQTWRMT